MQNFDQNIGFWEKRQFFRRKLLKIAENCDHNIDPRSCKTFFCEIKFFWRNLDRVQGDQIGGCSPSGRLFTLGIFLNFRSRLNFWATLFHGKSYALGNVNNKMGCATFCATFSQTNPVTLTVKRKSLIISWRLLSKQGDQMSLWKSIPKWSPGNSSSNLIHFIVEKCSQKVWDISAIFKNYQKKTIAH
jgi:hypothetical protein